MRISSYLNPINVFPIVRHKTIWNSIRNGRNEIKKRIINSDNGNCIHKIFHDTYWSSPRGKKCYGHSLSLYRKTYIYSSVNMWINETFGIFHNMWIFAAWENWDNYYQSATEPLERLEFASFRIWAHGNGNKHRGSTRDSLYSLDNRSMLDTVHAQWPGTCRQPRTLIEASRCFASRFNQSRITIVLKRTSKGARKTAKKYRKHKPLVPNMEIIVHKLQRTKEGTIFFVAIFKICKNHNH